MVSIVNTLGTKEYRYNAAGIRTIKIIDGNKEFYLDGVVLADDQSVKSYQTATGYAIPTTVAAEVDFYYNVKDWLGTNREVVDENGDVTSARDHYAYGMLMPGRIFETDVEGKRYQFSGHEFDNEVNYGYHGARYYNRVLGRYMSVDPMAHLRSWVSPYNFVQNNPINRIDPDGALDAPIYDEDGNFLGTDDQGLQGKAIVVNKDNFTQGMSHEDALKNSLGAEGLSSDVAKTKLLDHYRGLKDRPDYDGKLTFGEAIKHFNKGSGDPLFVDARKINLNATNVSELKADDDGYINFFPASDPNTGLVYGTIKLALLNENTGAVRLGGAGNLLDKFDFDPKKLFGRIADDLYPGTPKSFNIYCTTCTTKIRTAAEIKEFWEQVYEVMNEHPKY